jgi:hypothetical protein
LAAPSGTHHDRRRVDQSDSGQGDSAGIVAASLTRDGVVEHSVSDAVHGSATTPTSIVVIT